ncbi:hypothetical protein NBRC116592_09190 [Colwellia sp. KU-HH00111]
MVDAMDHHIGRLIQPLKDIGEHKNTVFVFTSDNSAEASVPNGLRILIPDSSRVERKLLRASKFDWSPSLVVAQV